MDTNKPQSNIYLCLLTVTFISHCKCISVAVHVMCNFHFWGLAASYVETVPTVLHTVVTMKVGTALYMKHCSCFNIYHSQTSKDSYT